MMKVRKRNVLCCMTAIMAACAITSCSVPDILIRRHGFGKDEYDVTVENNVNNLENKGVYIQKNDGTYHRLYVGDTNFRGGTRVSRRVMWYGKDFEQVPVMHKGEKLVYRSASEFEPAFAVERFQDLGYTLGICGMSPTSAGRYRFSTSPEKRSIDINSSAGQLYSLGDHVVTMDMIGEAQLRRGNISQAGTIIGLERGKTYSADVYIGTEVIRYDLVADVRAFLSMDYRVIRDFEYEQNKVVSFKLPEYYNSGYYYIMDFGLVKYVASDEEYSEEIAMNIPNAVGEGDKENDYAYRPFMAVTETVPFRIDEEGDIHVEVRFSSAPDGVANAGGAASGDEVVSPTARVIGDGGSYALNISDEGDVLSGVFRLSPGDYKIEITGLAGRTYSYMVSKSSKGGQ